jgi:hypothetical protein
MNDFLSKIIDSFKLYNFNHIFNADSEKNQNYSNSNGAGRSGSIWYISSNKHPKYPILPEYICNGECERFNYSTHGRYSSNHTRNCYSSYSSARCVQFFIEEERKHYRLLNTYVFEPLSHISLYNLTQFYQNEDNDVIPHHRMPTYYHYSDAVLHMKKDRGNLKELVESLSERVIEFNTYSDNANTQINREIANGIHQAGFDENNITQIHHVNEINRLVRTILMRDIYSAPAHEVYDKARTYNATLRAEGLQDATRDTIHYIILLLTNNRLLE